MLFSAIVATARVKDPQEQISMLEQGMRGESQEVIDSLKYSLLSRYIQEYRDNGKREAYDSLEYRVKELIVGYENSKAHNLSAFDPDDEGSDSLSLADSAVSEVELLRQENIALRKENEELKKGVKVAKKSSPVVRKRDKYTDMIDATIISTHAVADSLSKNIVFHELLEVDPIVFDSFSVKDFEPWFEFSPSGYTQEKTEGYSRTPFDEYCENRRVREKVYRRMLYKFAVEQPEMIEYYSLNPYYDMFSYLKESQKDTMFIDVNPYKVEPKLDRLNVKITRRNENSKWKSEGDVTLHFSQYYVSENWYKGGIPNTTLLSEFDYSRNYNDNDKVFWDNAVNLKIGFFNSRNDTIRAFRVYDDELKFSSRYGRQSFLKKWYYTASGEFKTSLFTSYSGVNSEKVVTSFLSPTRIFLGLGATYKHSKNVYAHIAPIAYKLIFIVGDAIEDPRTVGISEGHRSRDDWGYMLTGNLKWKFTREISVNSLFDMFSSYSFKNVEFNWQTSGVFIINRYLSTKLTLNLRFDNTPKNTDEENPSLQIQEQLSFGFRYVLGELF